MKTSKSQWSALSALVAVGLLAACGPVTAHSISCDDQMACSGHGTCIDTGGTAYCECDPGWGGTTCNGCAQGFSPNGEGDCIEGTSCDAICAAQGRVCDEVAGDVICGDCLPGFYLEGDRCIQACAADEIDGELVPLDLYIMLDKSASMQDAGKWDAVVAAIQQFVNASDVAGIGVGLQFFPVDPAVSPNVGACTTDAECGLYGPCVPVLNQCNGSFSSDSCDPADYDDAAVPIQTLPGVQQTILSALNAESPNGDSTPTQPAYEGAVVYATNWATANPDHLTFIVFATDGEPTNCTYNSIDDTASAAAVAATANPSVKTFVIGVGETLSSLHTIASSGGTGQAYIVDTGNVTQQFIDALNEIRNNGLCKYRIPQPDQGSPDYSLINVSLHDPNVPDSSETVFNVGDVTGCDAEGGWYYDDPTNPQMIELCPATCDEVQLGNLSVEILVGCATIVK